MTTEIRSIGDKISVARAAANTAATAGGTGDNTAVVGAILDRAAFGWPQSMVAAIPFTATLAAAATLSIGVTIRTGNDAALADARTLKSVAAAVVATGAGTRTGALEIDALLTGADRYVQINFTPDLSAANTDTAALSAVAVFGGAMRLPQ